MDQVIHLESDVLEGLDPRGTGHAMDRNAEAGVYPRRTTVMYVALL